MKFQKSLLGLGVLLASQALAAEAPEMSRSTICAATQVVECVAAGECIRAMPEAFTLPVLFRVDLEKQVVESARASGEKRVSAITSVTSVDGVFVLHGTDGADGWTATVDQASGQMTVASAHPGISYTVFGTCAEL